MTAELKVFTGGQNTQTSCGELAEKIKAVIYEYSDRVPLAAAVGVLEIVKVEIMQDHQ